MTPNLKILLNRRFLIQDPDAPCVEFAEPVEVEVREFSPSGDYVTFSEKNGKRKWYLKEKIKILETLE